MKAFFNCFVFVLFSSISICEGQQAAGEQSSVPAPTPYSVVSSDGSSSIWSRTVYEQGPNGQVVAQKHSYTELASGLNHLVNGQWVPSKEEIDILPDGTAAATNGQHQVYFPADIYNSEIMMVTPDGTILQSRPMGLSFDDGRNTVLIATLTNSIGELESSNVVVYPNAFVGINADLQYTYTKVGFEQDVILHNQPPAPESFNMNSQDTRLQMLTEFFNPPQTSVTDEQLPAQAGITLDDESLDFGDMTMGQGRAFLTGTNQDSGALVAKEWINVSGRQILIEEVPLMALADDLQQLPASTAITKATSPLYVVSTKRLLPGHPLAASRPKRAIIAKASVPDKGVVLDYVTLNSSTLTNYTFQANSTYFITGTVVLSGTNTFEGGTVIKYEGANAIQFPEQVSEVNWLGTSYRPVIITARGDNSVGEPISGSSGQPTVEAQPVFRFEGTNIFTISHVRIEYARVGIRIDNEPPKLNFYDDQFINCTVAVTINPYSGPVYMRNVLFANVTTNFFNVVTNYDLQNCTFNDVSFLASYTNFSPHLYLTNCIFVNVTNYGSASISGGNNGFYNSPEFGAGAITNATYPFQAAGAGDYYLTNGCAFLNAGTPNIDPMLLADLATKTVYPPNTNTYTHTTISTATTISTNVARDNSSTPSLGYHYDPIDYVVDKLAVTNATLTITNGAVLATYNEPGIQVENGGSIVSIGTPTIPNWIVRYQSVQEETNVFGGTNVSAGISITATNGTASGLFQFTKFSVPENGGYHFYDDGSSSFSNLVVQDCELYDGTNDFSGGSSSSVTLQNNLFQRSSIYASNTSASANMEVINDLFWGTTVTLSEPPSGTWYAFNDDFDSTTVTNSTMYNFCNAYLNCIGYLNTASGSDIFLTNSLAYQSSFFGNFYQPPTSPLIQMGSTPAGEVGLYEFTTQTNQMPETNAIVDIGYHYVATDRFGNPLDTYVSGTPNYIVDSQGTGLDTNGLPYWWEVTYYGQIGLTNLDSIGQQLLVDYTNNVDPNIIFFDLQFPQEVQTNIVNGSVAFNGGIPAYIAVLINDTNQADAIWEPFTSTNLTVNLDSGDGFYTISVGLRGMATNETAIWVGTQVQVYHPPALTLAVTNPASTTVSQPMIQLEGLANKTLSALTYDVSNALGVVTNQTGYWQESYYDTNAQDFTTNTFQCYDVPLTNGLNTITLHATDVAGDTITTNFSFTLSYAGDTTPPALNILWPQNGAYISGNSFTLQAQVDDDTATVTAQIVDDDGDTNTVQGLVERSGKVWVNNLPMATGTNTLTVTAVDAAGNTVSTNLELIQSLVSVTMNPLSSDQLNETNVNVTGTISDTNETYEIFVNGIGAYYTDDLGDWEATNVPVSPTGVATFDVEIYTGDPVNAGSYIFTVNQPPVMGLIAYKNNYYNNQTWPWSCDGGLAPLAGVENITTDWLYPTGGEYSLTYSGQNGDCEPESIADSYSLPGGLNGYTPTWEINSYGGSYYAPPEWLPSVFYWPSYYVTWTYAKEYATTGTDSSSANAQVGIFPGGPAVPGQKNLYLVQAQVFDEDTYAQIPGSEFQFMNQMPGTSVIDVTNEDDSVTSEGLVVAPSGTITKVTPQTPGDISFNGMQVYDVTPKMLVDYTRDGSLDTWTTLNTPYRFWINDSQEGGDISTAANAVPESDSPNYALNQINGRSDVVNYFPVALCLSNALQLLPPTNGWEYHLSQADSAVKIVYTDLTLTNAFDYLTNVDSYGYGTNGDESVTKADTIAVTTSEASGTILDPNWLMQSENNGGTPVILLEGCNSTAKPLMLEIWHDNGDGVKIFMGSEPLYLSISGVEQMYRWVNLRHVLGQSEITPTDINEPANYPDSLTDGKNFIFVHGYSVSETAAQGWNAEMFKRLYQSDSRAMFTAVTWFGNDGQIDGWVPFVGGDTPDYYTNVANAFMTASNLASVVNSLPGQKYIAGHSLGNMVVSSAIADYGLNANTYFMIDAAVAMEAYNASSSDNLNLVPPPYWINYSNQLWASKWYQLFDSSDARSTLTWSNRFGNILSAYNYYSSTEDVLADADGTLHSVTSSEFAWVNQEMRKGSWISGLVANDEAGWGFNSLGADGYSSYTLDEANSIPSSQLMTNSFFGWFDDANLYTPDGDTDVTNPNLRAQILGDGIPALSDAAGANTLGIAVEANHNMNNYKGLNANGLWPRSGDDWEHSDIVNIAYPFNYAVFNQIVIDGGFQ